jgi:hypothetical protein
MLLSRRDAMKSDGECRGVDRVLLVNNLLDFAV